MTIKGIVSFTISRKILAAYTVNGYKSERNIKPHNEDHSFALAKGDKISARKDFWSGY